MSARSYRTLHSVAGVYVIQFDGWVKVGISKDLRMRLRGHGKEGGTRARAWSAPDARWHVEEDALAALSVVGRLVRGREGFADVTFGQAVDVVRSAIARRAGAPVHELDGYTIDVVLPLPNPTTQSRYGWNGSHLLVVAS